MSEGAPEPTGSAGDPAGGSPQGSAGDPEDQEGQALLDGMTDQDPESLAEQLTHWKAQSRKHERNARQNAGAAKELADLKASQMTEVERANHERDEAQRERDEARADHTRVMAAAAHDLPVELIDYLGGGTEEEINDR